MLAGSPAWEFVTRNPSASNRRPLATLMLVGTVIVPLVPAKTPVWPADQAAGPGSQLVFEAFQVPLPPGVTPLGAQVCWAPARPGPTASPAAAMPIHQPRAMFTMTFSRYKVLRIPYPRPYGPSGLLPDPAVYSLIPAVYS